MRTDPKRVQAVFLSAVGAADPTARADILGRECGTDSELRRRVEALLVAHDAPGSLLERPAISSTGAEAVGGARPVPNLDETQGDPQGDREAPALGFLQPSTKPGSLGRLGHYEVLEVLGQGGFGIVLKAFDEMLHRVVAIKVMAAHLASTSPARKRFLREARAAAAVRHENVVAIHAVEEQPIPYLVMEYIAGRTLQERLDHTGPLEVPEVLRLGQQIARGLAAAHAKGLIHRDIKPANILIEAGVEEQVKITDFGLARAADDASLTQSGVIAGTPMYMAPEQAQGEVIDQRADLFSLGSVLYVMCSGRPPFRASTTLGVLKRVAEDKPRPIREIIAEVPEWLSAIVTRLHAKNPADRFASAKDVADALARHLADLPSPVVRASAVSAPASEETARVALPAPPMNEPSYGRETRVVGCRGHTRDRHSRDTGGRGDALLGSTSRSQREGRSRRRRPGSREYSAPARRRTFR
jgi:serine/threonine protein kinase